MLANERNIPSDMVICHKCDNRICVNPAHLFLGTRGDNNRDCVAKGRGADMNKLRERNTNPPKGSAHWNADFSEDVVRDVRARFAAGQKRKAIAIALGLGHRTVQRLLWTFPDGNYRKWRHVT